MILKQPYGSDPERIYWDQGQQRLLDRRAWGYVTKEGMVVLTCHFDRNLPLQHAIEHELDVCVFNGTGRPRSLEAWDEDGEPIPWTEFSSTWMLWDKQHHIILPQPTHGAPICYPHHTAAPYQTRTYERSWHRGRRKESGFTYTRANRRRAKEYAEFLKLVVLKGRLAGSPDERKHARDEDFTDALKLSPNLDEVSVELCQRVVYEHGLELTFGSKAIERAREAARDVYNTRYLVTKKWGLT